MRALRLLLASSLIALSLLSASASATSYSTDQSDLWYIPAESGWGIQLVQRGNLIFFTMFVYDPAGKPIWYVGTISPTGASFTWSGDMYVTSGPWLGAQPYNPALFGGRIVGTLTWNAPFVESGTLTYSVDGVAVTKAVVRQTLVNDNYGGTFIGAVHETTTCGNQSVTNEAFAGLTVAQNGTGVSFVTADLSGGSCSFIGQLEQDGQFGKMVGAYSCNTGEIGTFNMFEMFVSVDAIRARYTATIPNFGCTVAGYLGGIRHQ